MWRRRRRVDLLEEDKVMRRGDQVLTNLIFDLLPRLPRTASLCFHLWPDVGPGGHSAPLCIALLCLSWMTLCGSRHKCMVLSSQESIHPCSITFANVQYCSITLADVHYCSITFSSVLLPVIQSAPSGQLGWQQVATQDIGPLSYFAF